MKSKICFFLLILIVSSLGKEEAKEATQEFNLRPGAADHVTLELQGIVCRFDYTANGGTSEWWTITLSKTESDTFKCDVRRPNPPSYLVFDNFEVTFPKGKKSVAVVNARAEGLDGQLPEGELSLDGVKVSPGKDFKKSLGLLEVTVKSKGSSKPKMKKRGANPNLKRKKDVKEEL